MQSVAIKLKFYIHVNGTRLSYENITTTTLDKDVFILATSNLDTIGCNLFVLTLTSDKRRLIDFNLAFKNYFSRIKKPDYIKEMFLKDFQDVIPSSLFQMWKIKPLKILIQEREKKNKDNFSDLESFVYHMYGKKDSLKL